MKRRTKRKTKQQAPRERSLYWERLWRHRNRGGKSSCAMRRQWLTGILLQRGPWTVAQLAEWLGVSKATSQRDLYVLADLFDIHETIDPRHNQRTCYRLLAAFKPTIGAFPMRELKRIR